MSLAKLRKIDERRRHLPLASRRHAASLTPERSIEIQHLLGADITMAFDECTPFPVTPEESMRGSMELSMRWAERCRRRLQASGPATACSASCRAASIPSCAQQSAAALTEIGFDGYAIGGLAVGEGQDAMFDDARRDRAGAARERAALSDGRRQAGRPRRRGAARHRHVRLRAADALRPHRAGLHAARHGQPAQRAPHRRPAPARRRLRLPGLPRITAAPISTISCAPARFWRRCC